ncbi:cytochrome P450 [Kitasatospora sp. MMS16-BH015]|uniref:cytochrome P450 n=1 Tax=Kitasatospora sp. MMS16-BH015 TaxID=2018025 RepID=UPI000CA35B8C|nr:cytochrome P450 [Kitasatospora sp. MMS16-BH015]AUG76901.1 cytochrome P450 [Kitasatospora sp. MMS16-BH015]
MDSAAIIEQLMTAGGREDPYPLYRRAQELGAVTPAGEGIIMVSGYREVNEVLRDGAFRVADAELRSRWEEGFHDHSSKLLLSLSLLERNEPDHSRMRSQIASVFTARRVAALEPAVAAAVDRLLDEMAELGAGGAEVDFMETFAYRLPVTVICELLGVPTADRHLFRGLAADLTAALEPIAPEDELAKADGAADELSDYFTSLAGERQARPQDDLVSALVQVAAADPGRLSGRELLANLVLLLVAGFETTTNLLGNGLSLLLDHPGALAGVRSGAVDPAGYTEEVLRYDSPVQVTSRVSLGNGLKIGDLEAPYGWMSFLLIGAANRDPQRYPDPDRFDPTRRDSRPLSFGGGAHFCLGAQLARLESTLAMPALLRRFPALARAGAPTRRDRWVLRGYQSLPITLG